MSAVLPIQPRSRGLVFDLYTTNTDPHHHSSEYRLEEIKGPVLVLNARDDPAAQYEDARAMSQRIPRARLVTIEAGSHLMVGSGDLVRTEIDGFLRNSIR